MAGTTRLELATSDVTGLTRLPYYQGFQPLTLARESPKYILGTPFGVHFGVRPSLFDRYIPILYISDGKVTEL